MSTDSIEKLYKNFGILADAKDKLAEVSIYLVMKNNHVCIRINLQLLRSMVAPKFYKVVSLLILLEFLIFYIVYFFQILLILRHRSFVLYLAFL